MSRQRTLEKGINFLGLIYFSFCAILWPKFYIYFAGKDEIRQIVNNLHVSGGDSIIEKAHRFYKVYISIISQ